MFDSRDIWIFAQFKELSLFFFIFNSFLTEHVQRFFFLEPNDWSYKEPFDIIFLI
jgi:hypothetical protein